MTSSQHTDIAVVGSGFSGIAMAAGLRRAGHHDFVVLERADDLGGTWRDNAYPGCACDVPSHLYSLSFAPNPDWSSTFSGQPEIQAYLRRVARDEGLLAHMRFGCVVEAAAWDDDEQRWQITTSTGPLTARVLVTAHGGLSEPIIPLLPGLEDFTGAMFHSATWDHDHDLTGERVAVIGTGASAIQFVPRIQPQVASLHVFQRTAPWVLPRAARPLTRAERTLYRRVPAAQRLMREAIYWGRELYALPMLRARLARLTAVAGRRHLARQVRDPQLRETLTPDYLPGCKRILISNDYLPALTRPNVEVIATGVREVRARSVVTADGSEREVDTIIFGTGFHVTDVPFAERVRGRDGRTLAEHWDGSPAAHKATTVAGFPNLFILLGPNSATGHTSVVFLSEVQVGYVLKALAHLRRSGMAALEVRPEAQESWNREIQRRMRGTVWLKGGCASWYIDRNGRNSTLWPDFTFRFRRALRTFDPAEHRLAAPRPVVAPAEPVHTAA